MIQYNKSAFWNGCKSVDKSINYTCVYTCSICTYIYCNAFIFVYIYMNKPKIFLIGAFTKNTSQPLTHTQYIHRE